MRMLLIPKLPNLAMDPYFDHVLWLTVAMSAQMDLDLPKKRISEVVDI